MKLTAAGSKRLGRDDAAGKRGLGQRIGGLLGRLRKVADALQRGRHGEAGERVGAAVAHAFVREEEEGAVVAVIDVRDVNRAAERAAELVAPQLGLLEGEEVAGIESVVADELE